MRPSLPVPAFWQRAAMERAELYATLSTGSLGAATEQLVDLIASTLARRGRVWLCGNGGSAMAAQHAAAEWIGRFSTNRPALPAVALTTDQAVLTAVGNDFGFDRVFERQIDALAQPGEVVIGISTSGASANVAKGLRAAARCGAGTVALLGRVRGRVGRAADLVLLVPAPTVPLIQEAHECVLHVVCDQVEGRLRKARRGRRGGPRTTRGRSRG